MLKWEGEMVEIHLKMVETVKDNPMMQRLPRGRGGPQELYEVYKVRIEI